MILLGKNTMEFIKKRFLFKVIALFCICIFIFNLNTQSQSIFTFPKDSVTNKFSISEIISMAKFSKNEIYQNVKNSMTQLVYQNFDNQGKDDVVKSFGINSLNNAGSDSVRLFYMVNVTNISKKSMKRLVKNSYLSLMFHMYVYFKNGKYKIEFTDFSVSSGNFKIKGSVESVEKLMASDSDWNSVKRQIFDDTNYIKEKIKDNIAAYIKKGEF